MMHIELPRPLEAYFAFAELPLRFRQRLHGERGFFHWPLEFANVFYDDAGAAKAQPGFDAVIGMLERAAGSL